MVSPTIPCQRCQALQVCCVGAGRDARRSWGWSVCWAAPVTNVHFDVNIHSQHFYHNKSASIVDAAALQIPPSSFTQLDQDPELLWRRRGCSIGVAWIWLLWSTWSAVKMTETADMQVQMPRLTSQQRHRLNIPKQQSTSGSRCLYLFCIIL